MVDRPWHRSDELIFRGVGANVISVSLAWSDWAPPLFSVFVWQKPTWGGLTQQWFAWILEYIKPNLDVHVLCFLRFLVPKFYQKNLTTTSADSDLEDPGVSVLTLGPLVLGKPIFVPQEIGWLIATGSSRLPSEEKRFARVDHRHKSWRKLTNLDSPYDPWDVCIFTSIFAWCLCVFF